MAEKKKSNTSRRIQPERKCQKHEQELSPAVLCLTNIPNIGIKHHNSMMIPAPVCRLADGGSESSSTAYLAHSGPFVVGGQHGQQRLHHHQQRWAQGQQQWSSAFGEVSQSRIRPLHYAPSFNNLLCVSIFIVLIIFQNFKFNFCNSLDTEEC